MDFKNQVYADIVNKITTNLVVKEYLNDVNSLNNIDFQNVQEERTQAFSKLIEIKNKIDELVNEMNQLTMYEEKVTYILCCHTEEAKDLETKISELLRKREINCVDKLLKMQEISNTYKNMDTLFKNIDDMVTKLTDKKLEIIKSNEEYLILLMNMKELNDVGDDEYFNVTGIFPKNFEKCISDSYGDLKTSKRELASITQKCKELQEQLNKSDF